MGKYKYLQRKIDQSLFLLQYDVENFTFLPKYCQKIVGLNTSK